MYTLSMVRIVWRSILQFQMILKEEIINLQSHPIYLEIYVNIKDLESFNIKHGLTLQENEKVYQNYRGR